MPEPFPKQLKVVVTGGSIAGLCASNALLSAGFDVHVFERSGQRLSSRGAGIVVQPELLGLIAAVDAGPLAMTGCSIRRTVVASTGQAEAISMPQRFTTREAIYASLRSAFPDDRRQDFQVATERCNHRRCRARRAISQSFRCSARRSMLGRGRRDAQ